MPQCGHLKTLHVNQQSSPPPTPPSGSFAYCSFNDCVAELKGSDDRTSQKQIKSVTSKGNNIEVRHTVTERDAVA